MESGNVKTSDRVVITVAILGIAVAKFLSEGPFFLTTSLIGLVLLVGLHAADRAQGGADHSVFDALLFGGAWGLCFILVSGYFLEQWLVNTTGYSEDVVIVAMGLIPAILVSAIRLVNYVRNRERRLDASGRVVHAPSPVSWPHTKSDA